MAVQRIPFSAAESEFVEKRSRFIGQIWPVSTEEEAQAHIRAAKKKYHDARHNRVGAHNGFVDMLARHGIVGLLLMFLMLIALFAFIRRRKQCPTYRLALALWLMNFSFQVTQGGSMFHTDLLYALTFCLLEEEYIA